MSQHATHSAETHRPLPKDAAKEKNWTRKTPLAAYVAASSLLAIVVGCSGAPGESDTGELASNGATGENANPSPETASGTLLQTVTVSKDHIVEFRQLEGGAVATLEMARASDLNTVVKPGLGGLANVFRDLQPGAAVPQNLLDADRQMEAVLAKTASLPASEKTPVATTPAAEESHGVGPTFYTQADRDWFNTNVCVNQHTAYCLQYNTWGDVVTAQFFAGGGGGNWTAWAMPGSTANANTPFYGEYLNSCSTNVLGGCFGTEWDRSFTDSVQPGWWHSWHVNNPQYTNGQVHVHAGNVPGPTPTLSLAVKGYEGPPAAPLPPNMCAVPGSPGCSCATVNCVAGATCINGNTCYPCGGGSQPCCGGGPSGSCNSGYSCQWTPPQNSYECQR
jgi:hypothetical protein